MMEALAGEHTGDAQKKLVNLTPIFANRSRFGAIRSSFPAQCMAHAPWSSERINRYSSSYALLPLPNENSKETKCLKSKHFQTFDLFKVDFP